MTNLNNKADLLQIINIKCSLYIKKGKIIQLIFHFEIILHLHIFVLDW